MRVLKFTLIADGSSDKTLLRIIKWSLDNLYPKLPNEGYYADFRILPDPPKGLENKVAKAIKYYPFNILFIHRDAETISPKIINKRIEEIRAKLQEKDFERTICIVPIKMMETWLLFDLEAIKKAAGNRNYKGVLDIPQIKSVENEQQPKKLLHELLKEASGLKGRNLKKFNTDKAVHLVAENIENFSPLRNLSAFQEFEKKLKQVVDRFISE